jgi:hypothetical protein
MAQFRFQRSPWLVKAKTVPEILRENIRLTTIALKERTIEVSSRHKLLAVHRHGHGFLSIAPVMQGRRGCQKLLTFDRQSSLRSGVDLGLRHSPERGQFHV